MKGFLIFIFLTAMMVFQLPGWAADKKSDEKPSKKTASINEVSEQMAEAWCLKLEECDSKSEMSGKECRKVLKKSFNQGFKNTLHGQKVAVTHDKLSQCSESIKKDTCGGLKQAQTLPGCDFISLLNRY